MHNSPSQLELLEAVKRFIDETAAPQLSGHAGFHARVASNALATAIRDIAARPGNDTAERARLIALLNADQSTDLEALNKALSDSIRAGEITLATPGLLDHLKTTAIAQLRVDQPNYSGLKTATED